jgi:predicted ribosomally synthesized peptide with SipW-like signal peptide
MPLLFGTVVALVVGIGAGTAFAYFTSTGNGSGTITVGSVQSVTVVEATGTAVKLLYPGTSGDLLVTLDNPNSFSVTIVSISGNGTVTGTDGQGTCTTTGVTVPTQTGLSIAVAAGSNVSVVIPGGVSMDRTSESGCQGATFQVPISLTVRK